jgi:hypothetical protein
MNARSARRAARVLLAAGAVTVAAGFGTPAHADLCSPQPKPSIQMGASKGIFYEHESTTIVVRLTNPSCTNVSVDFWTSNGSAQSGSDYVGVAKVRLTFTPGLIEKKFVVAGVNDQVQEGVEYFDANLANATGGTISPYTSIRLFVDGVEPQ